MREPRAARRRLRLRVAILAACFAGAGGIAAQPAPEAAPETPRKLPSRTLDERPAFPLEKHLEQKAIADGSIAFEKLFEAGGDLFHTPMNGLDGVGMMRTVGGTPLLRFSTGPAGGGQSIQVGAQSCGSCHNRPIGAGAGLVHTRVLSDPDQNGEPPFSPRGTTSLLGSGALQLLAQEMTEELLSARAAAAAEALARPGVAARRPLSAKGVGFGTIAATADGAGGVRFDLSQVRGVSPDLVVRPMGWKGTVVTVRNLNLAASTFGLGMMGEEFVWRLPEGAGNDPDGDGVEREFSVGDMTAITIYTAAQETPTEVERLAAVGLMETPDAASRARVAHGRQLFAAVGCTSCHLPELRLASTVFAEPTLAGGGHYLDRFLAGKDRDYDPARPARFDLLADAQAPRLEAHPQGGAIVRLYGDLKRHEMGRHLAEAGGPSTPLDATLSPLLVDGQPARIGASEFLTAELWGVGDTGPWMHDDRAGSLAEAIALHGEDAPPAPGEPGRSEAQEARDAFLALAAEEQRAVVSFLKSLVGFSVEER